MCSFFAFSQSESVHKALLVGTLPVLQSSLLSDFGLDLDSSSFVDKFGFTEGEVEYLLKEMKVNEIPIKKIRGWYGGYRCRSNRHDEIDQLYMLYNPCSVLRL